MREILEQVERWRHDGKRVALATVVSVWGSAPRQPGSKMAVSSLGEIAGSVSGGCVEGAVAERAAAVLETGTPELIRFGVTDERAWEVGLTCGGQIEIFVEALETPAGDDLFAELKRSIDEDRLVARATVVEGDASGRQMLLWPDGSSFGGLGVSEVEKVARDLARELFSKLTARRERLATAAGEVDLFVEALAPRPTVIIVGAVHIAIPLVTMVGLLGFRSVVVDPRPAFATKARFGHADRLITDWPEQAFHGIGLNESSYVAVLAHDLKIERPALTAALRSPARYVGVLGSRKTHAKRVQALIEAGLTRDEIDRLHAPIGIDLGGRHPEEVAVSIAAEIVAARHGRTWPRAAPDRDVRRRPESGSGSPARP
jgi:xanthine dehydrogenase accessory factor